MINTLLFGTVGHVSWLQECARAAVIFAYGLVLVRVAGRRVFGKWSALDTIVSVIVGSSLSRALTGEASLGGTLAATTFIMVLHWLAAQAAARSAQLANILEGAAIELGLGGVVDKAAMRRHSVSHRDLDEALHQSSVENMSKRNVSFLSQAAKLPCSRVDQTATR